MKCPECGAENPENVGYCGLCLKKLVEEPGEEPVQSYSEKKEVSDQISQIQMTQESWSETLRKRRRAWLIAGSGLLAAAVVVVVAVVLLTGGKEGGPEGTKRYVSTISGLSFSYPESWESHESNFMTDMIKDMREDSSYGNEITLMKSGHAVFRHLLFVSSRTWEYADQGWGDMERMLKEGKEITGSSQGVKMEFFELEMPLEEEANGYGTLYKMSAGAGPSFLFLEAFIQKDDMSYSFQLTTPLKGGGADEQEARQVFDEIIASVEIGD